jgi:hypothetical protein
VNIVCGRELYLWLSLVSVSTPRPCRSAHDAALGGVYRAILSRGQVGRRLESWCCRIEHIHLSSQNSSQVKSGPSSSETIGCTRHELGCADEKNSEVCCEIIAAVFLLLLLRACAIPYTEHVHYFVKYMNAISTPQSWTGGGKPPHPPWMRCARPFWMRDVTRKRILRDTYICQVFENECDASTTSMDGWAWTAISS